MPVQGLPCFIDRLDVSRGPTQHYIVALLLVNGGNTNNGVNIFVQRDASSK
jgi:hypothetical protein